ncbi:MAG TPA: SDR family NAD(P)-dependent oxidoreductase [Chloroflexota bacterium]|jgi:NAD(P)-dependent dehydrogenase (short-subunit alcohol dehydrogenase family)|nr:SDR family NAD(P)-dependent oxidoreductase [Chloroflexota bacterium]
MPGRVADKVAVVVGGGQTPGEGLGNGRATALLLAREGARVVVADRVLASAEDTVAMIAAEGGEALAWQADVTDEASIKRLMDATVERYGYIHILHNNVGASIALGDARADEMTVEAFDRSFAVNFKSAWLAAKHALPVMRQRGGSIVNISSLAAWEAYPLVGYKTMKAALLALTSNLAAANARYNVRCNAILPGLMNTPMAIEARVAQGTPRADVIAAREKRVPLGHKMGTAWDVAYAALFLHSDEAGFISGAALPVDGAAAASFGSYD